MIHLTQTTKSSDVRDALVDKLFKAHHEHEMDISAQEVLREVAIDAGLEGPEVEGWLYSSVGRDVVDAEVLECRKMGIAGVPAFIIQGVHRVDGAQDPQAFLDVLMKVKKAAVQA